MTMANFPDNMLFPLQKLRGKRKRTEGPTNVKMGLNEDNKTRETMTRHSQTQKTRENTKTTHYTRREKTRRMDEGKTRKQLLKQKSNKGGLRLRV